ncbi:MAG: hypothetical protein U0L04_12205 [Bacteroidaceae bacterium]|nr:hypothetical protein [Bacteroidaceae bacterium]
MKQHSILRTLITVLLSSFAIELCAQRYWALAVMEQGKEKPTIMEYLGSKEMAENGKEYFRVRDITGHHPTNLQYGYNYRWADKQIVIYDFNSQKETIAFDFNLTPGNRFTTFNGMEWVVETVKDTVVNISFCGLGESVTKRLFTVRTTDGKQSDQWLEDFGSFTNLLMIDRLDNVRYSHTLWLEYYYGKNLAREINADPFFAHDSGWIDRAYESDSKEEYSKCYFENGQVVFQSIAWRWPHREFTCFYRDGDDIYRLYSCELSPHVDGGTYAYRKDVITFQGLPAPASGCYNIHIGGDNYTTGISHTGTPVQAKGAFYNLQGQRLWQKPKKGMFIKDGRKIFIK